MSPWKSLFLLGLLLLTGVVVRCQDEAEDVVEPADGGDEAEEGEAVEEADAAAEGGIEEDNGVLVLGDDNFHDFVNKNEIVLVEFYAPWCGHCKTLAPKYEAAAIILKVNEPPVPLAKVDATIHKNVAQEYGVSGYPTLKFFKSGEAFDYEGPREIEGIVDNMRERADPSWAPPPDAVLTLTKDNFYEVINGEDIILVEFYAPWCGHCKKLAPEYEKAAQDLLLADPPIRLAKVDATQDADLATEYGVTGYPTMKFFRKGKASEYTGGRTRHEIADYMRTHSGDASTEFTTKKELVAFVKNTLTENVIVGFFSDKEDPLYETYMTTANTVREDYIFAHTFDAAAIKQYKMKAGCVTLFKPERFHTKYEANFVVFDKADGTSEEVTAFLRDNDTPLVAVYDNRSKEKLYKSKRPLVFFFYTVDFSFDHRDATQGWRHKIADLASAFPQLTFAIADEDQQSDLVKEFGLDESGEEMNVGILDDRDKKYPMEPMEEFDSTEIREFLSAFLKGKLTPRIKSQPVPKKQKGPVTVVVAKTFDKVVRDAKKDVLIEFYAPWCGHCKKLDPILKKLAKQYKSEKNLVIAKMDATANDVPEDFEVQGFPTLYFVPASNAAVKYDGERELEGFTSYLESHATVSLGNKAGKDEL